MLTKHDPVKLAQRCREEAQATADPEIANTFREIADDLDKLVQALEGAPGFDARVAGWESRRWEIANNRV
ncbi:hypothetical protein [Sphingomonas alba]|uniref:Uncharacterized protein n=1 Tax=Sphingomonas alba TaxID=2908208 RepID=A0ABT0RR55_9SPHN|nr:hypothetical protein [Sphingomonas alba]MCL6684779.1 hypothetical protein [Sphingomonas alba]